MQKNLYKKTDFITCYISTYGVWLVSLVTEKITNNLRLLMARRFENEKWDIKDMLEILKAELETKENRSSLEVLLMILLRKTILLRLYNKTAKNLQKSHAFFVTGCLKISESSARKSFVKDNKLCFLCLENGHSVKSCSLAYSCHKRKGNHNIAICTYSKDQDSLNTASATNLSNNPNNILLQTAFSCFKF